VDAECPLLGAQVLVAQPAIPTDAAIEMRLDGDEVSLADVSDPSADRVDDAGDLVAEHGPGSRVVGALEDPCVRPADPDRQGPESDLEGSGVGDREVVKIEPARLDESDGLHRARKTCIYV
jgi:hypothetical protein